MLEIPKNFHVYGALFMTIFFWSSTFVGIRYTLKAFSPGRLALLRFLVSSSYMGFIYQYLSEKKVMSGDKYALMGLGILGIGTYHFFKSW